MMSVLKKILGIFFKSKKKDPVPVDKVVVSASIITEDGKKYVLREFNDGTTERVPYDDENPTGVGGLTDD